jgi:hypothetical protein
VITKVGWEKVASADIDSDLADIEEILRKRGI